MVTPDSLPPCPACGQPTVSTLACLACGVVLDEPSDANHFTRLGLDPLTAYDADAAETHYLKLSRALHPDFQLYGDSDAALRAVSHSALLNEAKAVLDDGQRRAEYLLELHDPGVLERHKVLSPEFLMEAMELSEEVEEAADIGCHDTLRRIASAAQEAYDERMESVALGCAATIARIAHAGDRPETSEAEREAHPHEWTTERIATLLHQAKVYQRILRDVRRAS